jgi:hypothetical protein
VSAGSRRCFLAGYPTTRAIRANAPKLLKRSRGQLMMCNREGRCLPLLITEVGPPSVTSREDIAGLICHHFQLMRYEFHVLCSNSDPFLVVFSKRSARGAVFVRGRISDGPVYLTFHAWEADRFGDHEVLSFHVKLSIEGLPHHAWFQYIVDKILCDEAVVHHVDQSTRHREGLRSFNCWAFSRNPSRIPQVVFLTLTDRQGDPRIDAQLQFIRPHNVKHGQVFKVIIHIDSVEDLMFHHQPHEQRIAEGKV